MLIRNSEALTTLLAIAADPRVSWNVVEVAGRGFSADARSTSWAVSTGKKSLDSLVLADLLMEKGELVEDLVDAWRLFDRGETGKDEFETRLRSLVEALGSGGRPYL
jgi:hypothetical protein